MSQATLENTATIHITLPDGSVREMARGSTGAQIAAAIGAGLAKAALAVKVNGEEWDLSRPIEKDASVAIITGKAKKRWRFSATISRT